MAAVQGSPQVGVGVQDLPVKEQEVQFVAGCQTSYCLIDDPAALLCGQLRTRMATCCLLIFLPIFQRLHFSQLFFSGPVDPVDEIEQDPLTVGLAFLDLDESAEQSSLKDSAVVGQRPAAPAVIRLLEGMRIVVFQGADGRRPDVGQQRGGPHALPQPFLQILAPACLYRLFFHNTKPCPAGGAFMKVGNAPPVGIFLGVGKKRLQPRAGVYFISGTDAKQFTHFSHRF